MASISTAHGARGESACIVHPQAHEATAPKSTETISEQAWRYWFSLAWREAWAA
jgi:uncharacterized protein YccT (UPF0319 family)